MTAYRLLRRDEHGRSAIVDARGVSRSDGSALLHDRSERGQFLERGLSWMLIPIEHDKLALYINLHRRDFPGEISGGLRRRRSRLAVHGERILIFAAYAKAFSDDLGGLRHGGGSI